MNPYNILGLNRNSTQQEIFNQYKKLALKFHPDKNKDGEEIFKRINDAYKKLSSVELRKEYDINNDDDDGVNPYTLLTGGDPVSKKYRAMFQMLINTTYIKNNQVFESLISDFRMPKSNLNINYYQARINTSSKLYHLFPKSTFIPNIISWKHPLSIDEKDLKAEIKTYEIKPYIYEYKPSASIRYPVKQLERYEYGIFNIFDIENNQLACPIKQPNDISFIPKYQLKPLPVNIPDERRSACNICRSQFTFFNRRHHCRMCGEIQCDNCQTSASIPHLGYIIPTRICRPCHNQLPELEFDLWASYLPDANFDWLAYMRTLYYLPQKWVYLGDQVLNHNIDIAWQCYYYGNINYQKFKEIISICLKSDNQNLVQYFELFGFNKYDQIRYLFDGDNSFNLGLDCIKRFKLPCSDLAEHFYHITRYDKCLVILKSISCDITTLAVSKILTSLDYALFLLKYGKSDKLNSSVIVNLLRNQSVSSQYRILKELITDKKVTYQDLYEPCHRYLYLYIVHDNYHDINKIVNIFQNSDILGLIKYKRNDWDLEAIAMLKARNVKMSLLGYKMHELRGNSINWKLVAKSFCQYDLSLAFGCWNFEIDDIKDFADGQKLSIIGYFYNKFKHDSGITKQLATKLYNQTKNLEIAYACLAEFGIDSNLCPQFHRLIVQNETDPNIIIEALKYYYDQSIYDTYFGTQDTEFWNRLYTAIYDKSPLAISNLSVDKCNIKMIEKALGTYFKDSTGIFATNEHLLKAKISLLTDNLLHYMEHLQSALVITPNDDTSKAVYIMDNSDVIYYQPRVISIPTSLYADKLRSNGLIKTLRKCEKYIATLDNPFEQGMLYIDFSDALSHPLLIANCYLMASTYFVKYGRYNTHHMIPILALIRKLLRIAYALTDTYLDVWSQKHVFGIILDFMKVLDNYHLIDPVTSKIGQAIVIKYTDISKLVPFNTQLMNCLDTLYLSFVNREYLTYKFKTKANNSIFYQYHFFEGIWQGWIDDDFATERLRAMTNLNNHGIQSSENLMCDPIQTRINGWITGDLNLNKINFKDIDGFKINKRTGELSFMFYGSGLFDMDDVMEVLGCGITTSFFTLDPPDAKQRHNPYQKMIYGPSCLSRTRYLATLLGADYLLKQFSTGIETNSRVPFNFRRFIHGIDTINSISGTGGHITRFWIEPDSLKYSQTEEDDIITILFNDVNMTVKHHEMHYDEEGNLVDNDDHDDNTPDGNFARTFTENYDRIGTQYPILLRLKPLLKLGIISIFINSVYDGVKVTHDHDYNPKLNELKSNFADYPFYTYNKVEAELDKLCSSQGLNKSRVGNLGQIRNDITTELTKVDSKILNNIRNNFTEAFEIGCTNNDIHNWLMSKSNYDITNKIQQKNNRILSNFKDQLRFVNLNPDRKSTSKDLNEPCLVPAVFNIDDNSRVYGGVNMSVNLQQSNAVQYQTYNQGSKVWQVSTNSEGTYSSYTSTNPNSNAQGYYRATNNIIHHITDHSSLNAQQSGRSCVNVHWANGSQTVYTQQANGFYMPK